MQRLTEFIKPMVRLAKYALSTHEDDLKDADLYEDHLSEEETKPLLLHHKQFMDPTVLDQMQYELPSHLFERTSSVEPRNWTDEFIVMGLPHFSVQYIQLIHVPLDVMRECLKMQDELGKDVASPSAHTVKQVSKLLD